MTISPPAPRPPRVFISYSHEPDPASARAREHSERVLNLAYRLRDEGVDAQLDLYEVNPPEGWPTWMAEQPQEADFVIVVCTATYLRRWRGQEVAGIGNGVRWEGRILRKLLLDDSHYGARVIPVLYEGASVADIPVEIAGQTHRRLPADYDDLYRQVTNQPAYPRPPLGELRSAVDNIPTAPQVFAGRHHELTAIEAALGRAGEAALVQAITGLGGVGKTRLALEYARTRAAHYDVRWWTRADRFRSDLAELGVQLGITSREVDVDPAFEVTITWLKGHSRWIIIIDNADDPGHLREIVPLLGVGHLLITSRATAWRGTAVPIDIKVLPPESALELLVRRSGQADDGRAAELARVLGYLPLALVQAAAYIEAAQSSFAAYLRLLESDGVDLLSDPLGATGDYYSETVATTWRPSFAAVRREDPAAAALLDFLAFLDHDGVPLALLSEKTDHLPGAIQPLVRQSRARDRAVALLLRYSLIERDGDVLRVHRLVQVVTRDSMDAERRAAFATSAVAWASAVFTYDLSAPRVDDVPDGIAQQIVSLVALPDFTRSNAPDISNLLHRVSEFLVQRGDLDAALQLSRRSCEIAEAQEKRHFCRSTKYKQDLALALIDLGDVCVRLGALSGASEHFRRSLQLLESLPARKKDHSFVVRDISLSLERLGNVQDALGDAAAALGLYRRCFELKRRLDRVLPPSNTLKRDMAVIFSKLARCEAAVGAIGRARTFAWRAVDYCRQLLELAKNSLSAQGDVCHALCAVGYVELAAGNVDAARERYLEALSILTEVSSADPRSASAKRDLAMAFNNLGTIENGSGNLAPAYEYFCQALQVRMELASMVPLSTQMTFELAVAYTNCAAAAERVGDTEAMTRYISPASTIFAGLESRGEVDGYRPREILRLRLAHCKS